MKAARLIVLGVALAAGLSAAYLIRGEKEPAPVQMVLPPPPPPPPKDAVLVASHDLKANTVIVEGDMRWKPIAKDQVPPGTIEQSVEPTGIQDFAGAMLAADVPAGDPLQRDRLDKDFMASELTPGMRAVAIELADQGKSAAAGFIRPGKDRVDVIRTFHPDDAPGATASETILTNIRVLAIGQAAQQKAGEHNVMGATALIELTPEQAEKVVLAQRTGQLTLSLRSMLDSANSGQPSEQPKSMTIIRFGNASQSRVR